MFHGKGPTVGLLHMGYKNISIRYDLANFGFSQAAFVTGHSFFVAERFCSCTVYFDVYM